MEDGKRKDLVPAAGDGGPGGGGDAPGDPRGKADAAIEFAREKAERLLDVVKLRKRIHDAKGEIAGRQGTLGRTVRRFLADHTAVDPLLMEMLGEIDAVAVRIEHLETDEREAAAEAPREGFMDRLKQGAARAAGIAKYTLQKSLLERDRVEAERALGECVALHADRFADLVAASAEVAGDLAALKAGETGLAALEAELSALERGGEGRPEA